MASTDRQMARGAILLLTNGEIWSFVKQGRQAEPMTIFVRQRGGPEREIPLTELDRVMWSP